MTFDIKIMISKTFKLARFTEHSRCPSFYPLNLTLFLFRAKLILLFSYVNNTGYFTVEP